MCSDVVIVASAARAGQIQGRQGAAADVRVVCANLMHGVAGEGSGVEKMSDLKGKRVSTGLPGGATELMAFRVIEAAGLDKDKDMRRERLPRPPPRHRAKRGPNRAILLSC